MAGKSWAVAWRAFAAQGEAMDYLDNRASSDPRIGRHRAALALADRLEGIGGFARQVRALRCCGVTRSYAGDSLRDYPCNLRFCPVCQPKWRRRMLLMWGARVEALRGSEGEIMAVTLTCSGGDEDLHLRKAALRGWLSRLFRRHSWKAAEGHVRREGVLLATEVGPMGEGCPLPHAHLLLVGSDSCQVATAAQWLVRAWLDLVPGASPHGQDVSFCERPDGARAWLNYILKGDDLDPSWDDARLEAGARTLVDGSHRVRVLGILRHLNDSAGAGRRQEFGIANQFRKMEVTWAGSEVGR